MPPSATKRNGHSRKPRVTPSISAALRPRAEGRNRHEAVEAAVVLTAAPDTRLKPGANECGGEWLLWQLADSAFPTGGFGHSGGLEAAWQHGEVTRANLPGFLETSLRQCARASLPFVAAAHAGAERLTELDQHCEAFLSNHVANRASRLQGRAFWTATTRAFLPDLTEPPELCHLAPVFGVLTCRLGIATLPAARLFLFLHFRGLVSSAVRLGIVGPLEAQSMQHQLAPVAEAAAIHAATLTLDDLAQTAPLLDLWQGAQDRLYSRLFQS